MPTIALCSMFVFLLVAFGIRTWLHLRETGRTGFVGVRPGASLVERMAAVAMVLAFLLVPVAVWIGTPVLPSTLVPVGLALVALGIIGTFVAQLGMRESWRIGVDPGARTALVTTGTFRWVRNPIFTMMIVHSLGLALVCSTPVMLVLPWVLAASLQVQVRVVEEPYLQQVHGAAYREWAAHTGRFVPGLGLLDA